MLSFWVLIGTGHYNLTCPINQIYCYILIIPAFGRATARLLWQLHPFGWHLRWTDEEMWAYSLGGNNPIFSNERRTIACSKRGIKSLSYKLWFIQLNSLFFFNKKKIIINSKQINIHKSYISTKHPCFLSSKDEKLKIDFLNPWFITGFSDADEDLIKNIRDLLNCSNIRNQEKKRSVEFQVRKFSDIETKIIPFFSKYKIEGVNYQDFLDFCEVTKLMQTKVHLTEEGLKQIREIKGRKIGYVRK